MRIGSILDPIHPTTETTGFYPLSETLVRFKENFTFDSKLHCWQKFNKLRYESFLFFTYFITVYTEMKLQAHLKVNKIKI